MSTEKPTVLRGLLSAVILQRGAALSDGKAVTFL